MAEDLRNSVIGVCLENISDRDIATWFSGKLTTIDQPSSFFLAFGMINKKIERKVVQANHELSAALSSINPAFDNTTWTLHEFCRLAFLLSLPTDSNSDTIKTLLSTSDIREQVTIYKSIQYLANPEAFLLSVIDGIRTNMVDIFDAITADNSYPIRFFEESSWNQMVLKAIFMERPIFKIYGIDQRRNEKLANILHDFVHERWSAHRPVTPELWRMISGFLNNETFEDLKKVVKNEPDLVRTAALKVIEESNFTEATNWLKTEDYQSTEMTWDEIGRHIFYEKNKIEQS